MEKEPALCPDKQCKDCLVFTAIKAVPKRRDEFISTCCDFYQKFHRPGGSLLDPLGELSRHKMALDKNR